MLLVLFAPLMLLVALLLYISNNGKVFFVQTRIGYRERPFRLIKFKTMLDLYDSKGRLLPDELRQFAFGNFIRYYHLDELPQLFNILAGDIQLIGPRPLLPEYLPYYSTEYRKRHNCRPGMTGLAQVMGGNGLDWDQRFKLDCFYLENCSAVLDLRIWFLTIKHFLTKRAGKMSVSTLYSQSYIEYVLQRRK